MARTLTNGSDVKYVFPPSRRGKLSRSLGLFVRWLGSPLSVCALHYEHESYPNSTSGHNMHDMYSEKFDMYSEKFDMYSEKFDMHSEKLCERSAASIHMHDMYCHSAASDIYSANIHVEHVFTFLERSMYQLRFNTRIYWSMDDLKYTPDSSSRSIKNKLRATSKLRLASDIHINYEQQTKVHWILFPQWN